MTKKMTLVETLRRGPPWEAGTSTKAADEIERLQTVIRTTAFHLRRGDHSIPRCVDQIIEAHEKALYGSAVEPGASALKEGDPVKLTSMISGTPWTFPLDGWTIHQLPRIQTYILSHANGSKLAVAAGEFVRAQPAEKSSGEACQCPEGFCANEMGGAGFGAVNATGPCRRAQRTNSDEY